MNDKIAPFLSLMLSCSLFATAQIAFAGPILEHRGLSTQKDKKNRSPILSVSIERDSETEVRILADAQTTRKDAQDHPLRFDFYVNRSLVESQIRSLELPGPVGISVNTQTHPFPFNYAVIATHVYPNGHSYPTMISGAVFANELSGSVNCDLTLSGQYNLQASAENVNIAQASETGFQYSFAAESDDEKKVTVSGSVVFDPDTGSANGKIVHSLDKSGQEIAVTGDVSVSESEGAVTAFSLASPDGSVQIDCASSVDAALEDVFDGVDE